MTKGYLYFFILVMFVIILVDLYTGSVATRAGVYHREIETFDYWREVGIHTLLLVAPILSLILFSKKK